MMQNVVPHTKSTLRNVLFGGGGLTKCYVALEDLKYIKHYFTFQSKVHKLVLHGIVKTFKQKELYFHNNKTESKLFTKYIFFYTNFR